MSSMVGWARERAARAGSGKAVIRRAVYRHPVEDSSSLTPYTGIIDARLAEFSKLSARLLFEETCAAAYEGSYGGVRDCVRTPSRERRVNAYARDIVAGYFPGALVADRTALEFEPAADDGSVCLVTDSGADIQLPGVRLRRRHGAPAQPDDRPFTRVPEAVVGTLRRGFDLYSALDAPFSRAAFMHMAGDGGAPIRRRQRAHGPHHDERGTRRGQRGANRHPHGARLDAPQVRHRFLCYHLPLPDLIRTESTVSRQPFSAACRGLPPDPFGPSSRAAHRASAVVGFDPYRAGAACRRASVLALPDRAPIPAPGADRCLTGLLRS